MEKIIIKAIEGGWKEWYGYEKNPRFVVYQDTSIVGIWYIRWDTFPAQPLAGQRVDVKHMFFDRNFWQSLARSCKWNDSETKRRATYFFIQTIDYGFDKAVENLLNIITLWKQ